MKRKHFITGLPVFLFLICLCAGSAFGLSLQEAIDLARKNNKNILEQKKQVEIVTQGIAEAKSGYLPQLSLGGNYTYYDKERKIYVPALDAYVRTGFHNEYLAEFQADQLIFDWGKTINNINKIGNQVAAELERLRELENQLVYDIREIFYRILYLKKNIAAYNKSLKAAQENLRISKEKNKHGRLSEYEVLRAKVEVDNLGPNIVWADNQLKVALKDLEIYLGGNFDTNEIGRQLTFSFGDITKEQVREKALAYNSGLLLLDLEGNDINYQLKIAAASNKPQVHGFYNYSYLNPFDAIAEWDNLSSAGIEFSFPFFDGFRTSHLVNKSKIGLEKNAIVLADQKHVLERNIEEAYLDFIQAGQLVSSQRTSIERAELGLEIAQTRFREGLSTQLELLDAQSALLDAQVNINYAEYKLAKSFYQLEYLSGGPVYYSIAENNLTEPESKTNKTVAENRKNYTQRNTKEQ